MWKPNGLKGWKGKKETFILPIYHLTIIFSQW